VNKYAWAGIAALMGLATNCRPGLSSAAVVDAPPDSAALERLQRVSTAVRWKTPHAPALPVNLGDLVSPLPKRFAFLYEDAMGNRVDTIDGSVTKDRNLEADTTTALRFSEAELTAVYREMLAIRYFDFPEDGPQPWRGDHPPRLLSLASSGESDGADGWIRLYARTDSTVHRVRWSGMVRLNLNGASDEMLRLTELVNLIWSEVAKHPEYRALLPERQAQW
jgi:hypothetical protein